MRRSILLSMVMLGGVVTAVAGTGTFAPFTDRATSGPNSVASGARPKAADLKIAYPVSDYSACRNAATTYVDDSTTPGLQVADAQPGMDQSTNFCLKNGGASTLTVSSTTVDLVEVDTACTGDEAEVDTTCGNNGLGELGSVLFWTMYRVSCTDGSGPGVFGGSLAAPTPAGLGTLAPDEIGCFLVYVNYPLNRTADDVQRAQSDTATWKFAFDATT